MGRGAWIHGPADLRGHARATRRGVFIGYSMHLLFGAVLLLNANRMRCIRLGCEVAFVRHAATDYYPAMRIT